LLSSWLIFPSLNVKAMTCLPVNSSTGICSSLSFPLRLSCQKWSNSASVSYTYLFFSPSLKYRFQKGRYSAYIIHYCLDPWSAGDRCSTTFLKE
jgi:hypothetical protein